MEDKEIKKLKEIIEEVEKIYSFNDYIWNYITKEDLMRLELDDLEDFFNELNGDNNITNVEVIYYHNAIDFLKENDISLRESLDLAMGFGYKIKDINSELLASLLRTQNNEDDYVEFVKEVIKQIEEYYN